MFVSVALAGCAGSPSEKVIKIGCAGPLTGDQAQLGMDCCRGVRLAVEEANAAGHGLAGYKLELMELDDQHNPSQAVNVAKKFTVDPDLVGVIGHFNSSCTKPASAVYHQARITQITAASTNPALSQQGFDTFFRVAATDDVQGPNGAEYAQRELKVASVFVIDDKTTYGKGLADEFEKRAAALGITVLGHQGITQGDKDFTPLLTKIKPLMPDLIYFGGIYPEGALVLRQMRALGIESKFMGGDGLATPIFSELAGEALADGVYATMIGGDMAQIPSAVGFIEAYEKRFGEIGQWSAYGYDAANFLIAAITKAGVKDRQAVLKAMREIPKFDGITGEIFFDAKGDNQNQFIGMFVFSKGKLAYLGPAASAE